jgi:hypothetical protein
MNPKVSALALDLEIAIKGCIDTNFEEDNFLIKFDHQTINRFDDAFHGIGLSTYGMSYTESEIRITLQLSLELTELCGNNLFHFCQFSIDNSGNFDVELDSTALDEAWHVSLMTPFDQHLINKATTNDIEKAIEHLRLAFQTKLLTI